jgi:hypothetical protein
MDAIAPLSWIEWEYTVYLGEEWAVDLDAQGEPTGEPRRVR